MYSSRFGIHGFYSVYTILLKKAVHAEQKVTLRKNNPPLHSTLRPPKHDALKQ
jgi:hypothetical protein